MSEQLFDWIGLWCFMLWSRLFHLSVTFNSGMEEEAGVTGGNQSLTFESTNFNTLESVPNGI